MGQSNSGTAAILEKADEILRDWMQLVFSGETGSEKRTSRQEAENQGRELLSLLRTALRSGDPSEKNRDQWRAVEDYLGEISRDRVLKGFTADQTAGFVFALKKTLFARLRTELARDPEGLAAETWYASELIDRLAMTTVRSFQQGREAVIVRQQEEMLELSTPVVKIWDGILALPMIGTLDSGRTQVVMESLLQAIVDTGAQIAILDITGVPTVDTLVAQHLLKTVTAIRLMGAECIISGVRPQIAQTIVHLGVDLQGVTTKASLADALALAFKRTGIAVNRATAGTGK
jgi:rsbT co-antagonist protein RsbR